MIPSKLLTATRILLSASIVLLFILLQPSCKKTDSVNRIDIINEEDKIISQKKADDFFKLPPGASPILYRIVNELQKQNKTKEFISDFVKKDGFPVWTKASIEVSGHKIKNNSRQGFDGEGLEDTTVYIPLVVSDQHYVHGFLKATVADTVEVKIFRQNDYIYFPFETPLSTPGITTAENYALRMMLMDKDVFGSNEFKIQDKRMFNNSTDYKDTANIQRFIKLDTSSGANYFSNGASVNNYTYEMCYTVITLTSTPCQTFSNSGGNNIAQTCWTASYSELCITYEVGGEEGDSWPFPPPTGGGGGGNPGGGGGDPCNNFGENIINSVVPIECEPGPGENPWPSRDANGYLYSRLTELNNKLSLNPYALEPCDSLNIMPLDPVTGYGSMYQRIAQFTPSQYVLDRVDSIRSVAPNWIVDNFNIQSLEDAYGPVVNCDFFPVRITQLPPGMSASDLVEYFRMHLTDSFARGSGVSFYPYLDLPQFSDANKWNQPYESSLGALVHIQIPGNDGSVLLSDYTHNYNNGYEHHRFKFTTMETPFDEEHPVAGNREFGIYNVPSLPGEFTFYTMGVDRTWDLGSEIQNQLFNGFGHADALWQKVQQNLIAFINNQGGQAGYYSNHQTIARPKWNDVKRYLRGEIDFNQLKVLLGC